MQLHNAFLASSVLVPALHTEALAGEIAGDLGLQFFGLGL
jgi:hypothetical protein